MKINIPGKRRVVTVYPAGGSFIPVPGDGVIAVDVIQPGLKYLLRDEFTTALAAGSVNGTAAEPGPGTRTVVDTGSRLFIASGNTTYAAGGASMDPRLQYGTVLITPGSVFLTQINSSIISIGGIPAYLGIKEVDDGAIGSGGTNRWYVGDNTGGILACSGTASGVNVASPTVIGTNYVFGITTRSAGVGFFVKGGIYTNNTLLYISNVGTLPASGYIAISGNLDPAFTSAFLRIPLNLWLPTPLLSDGFGGTWPTTDGLGHAEGIAGGLGSGGGGKTWTARLGTWGIAAGVASCSALDVSGIGIATVTLNTPDVWYSCVLGYSAGSAGVIVRYTDAQNYVYVVNDGTNVKLFEVTAASPYPGTQRGTGVKAPAAGARLIVDVSGAAARVYYNEALIFAYASIADTTGKTIGLITDNTGNTFNDAVAYAKGTGGEYNILDRYLRD